MKVEFEDYKEIERIFDLTDSNMKIGFKSGKVDKVLKEFIESVMYCCRKSVLSEMEVV